MTASTSRISVHLTSAMWAAPPALAYIGGEPPGQPAAQAHGSRFGAREAERVRELGGVAGAEDAAVAGHPVARSDAVVVAAHVEVPPHLRPKPLLQPPSPPHPPS